MKKKLSSANLKLFSYFGGLAILGSIVLQIPHLYKSHTPVPYLDGLFTAVSALCVTGLSTVDMSVYTNIGFIVILLIIEAGGLGLISFFTLFLALPARRLSLVSRRIVKDYFISDVESNPSKIIRQVIIYTLTIQTIGAFFLFIFLRKNNEANALFYAIFLSVSAFCNAGFAPYSDSLARFSSCSSICITISFLIIFGGLGFTVLQDLLKTTTTRFKKSERLFHLSLHSKIVLLVSGILIILPAVFFLFAEWSYAFKNLSLPNKILNALFQSITTRTAGFETIPQKMFSPASTFITDILMLVGGSPGSMAGGLKTTTIFLALCAAFRTEDDYGNLSIFKRDISDSNTSKATGIIVKAFLFLALILISLFFTEKESLSSGLFSISDLVFETASALGTVGLSKGITSLLSPFGKIFIIITMFAGRTGIISLSLNFTTSSQTLKRFTDYPSENILVG